MVNLWVSVSLRSYIYSYWLLHDFYVLKGLSFKFPSPYGVSFILIVNAELYVSMVYFKFPSPYGVSFILINIESYSDEYQKTISFRLLMELYSFLQGVSSSIMFLILAYFRLLTELYSFLWTDSFYRMLLCACLFPSPYGVIFILILWSKNSFIAIYF